MNGTRDRHGVRTIIPAKRGRPTDKLPTDRYRRLMKQRFDRQAYRRHTQVETVISIIKRRQGTYVRGHSYHAVVIQVSTGRALPG